MFTQIRTLLISAVLATAAQAPLTLPASAQSNGSQSAEEMAERFKKQKTRGLVIAKPEDVGVTAVVPNKDEQVTKVALPEIPQDEQVNINISFDFDSAALRADQRPKLQTLCQALVAADVKQVRILGHTDSSGSAAYNLHLSTLRAEEVKRFLVSDCNYPEDRLQAIGVGEEQLFDQNNPRGDVNRRVEFQALS